MTEVALLLVLKQERRVPARPSRVGSSCSRKKVRPSTTAPGRKFMLTRKSVSQHDETGRRPSIFSCCGTNSSPSTTEVALLLVLKQERCVPARPPRAWSSCSREKVCLSMTAPGQKFMLTRKNAFQHDETGRRPSIFSCCGINTSLSTTKEPRVQFLRGAIR